MRSVIQEMGAGLEPHYPVSVQKQTFYAIEPGCKDNLIVTRKLT